MTVEFSVQEVITRSEAAAEGLREANAVYVDAETERTNLVALLQPLMDDASLRVLAEDRLGEAGAVLTRAIDDTDRSGDLLTRFAAALEDALAV